MADCKHEKIIPIDEDGNKIIDFIYWCDECNNANFEEDEVVILTKEQHDKREAVIEAAKETWEDYNPHAYYSDGPRNLDRVTVVRDALFRLHDALEAYEGSK